MPGINGWEVLKVLKQNEITRDIPVIILTASQEKVNQGQALAVGAARFFLKPFEEKELIKLLEEMLHT
jgi:CheY-like chemotaxis protein